MAQRKVRLITVRAYSRAAGGSILESAVILALVNTSSFLLLLNYLASLRQIT